MMENKFIFCFCPLNKDNLKWDSLRDCEYCRTTSEFFPIREVINQHFVEISKRMRDTANALTFEKEVNEKRLS